MPAHTDEAPNSRADDEAAGSRLAPSGVPFHGHSTPRFRTLRAAFARAFSPHDDEDGELGAALAVAIGGALEVDLWGGWADRERTKPWTRDTLVNVYSATKGVAATCVLRLIERGQLDVEAPVARYWPEFAAQGKDRITVRQLLSHQAGLAGIRQKIPYAERYDRKRQAEALAAQEPWWEPGTQHGYHAVTFGTLIGELFERVEGRSIGRYWREEISDPLHLDFHIGLAPEDFARCAELVHPTANGPRRSGEGDAQQTPSEAPASAGAQPARPDAGGFSKALRRNRDSLLGTAFANPAVPLDDANTPEWRAAEQPAHGGHGSARGLARFYSALASGGTLGGLEILRPETIAQATAEQVYGRDAVLAPLKTRFGLGFMLSFRGIPLGRSRQGFGHPGYGGAVAFADPEQGLGFAFVMNRMQPQLMGGAQGGALMDALYEALDSCSL